jgi:hypothetical protein
VTDEAAVMKVPLDRHGRTYAEQAGIRLADTPAPLYQLQVLSTRRPRTPSWRPRADRVSAADALLEAARG